MEKIKSIYRNMSIRKAFMLYMLLFLLIAAFFTSIAVNWADYVRQQEIFEYLNRAGNGPDYDEIQFYYLESDLPEDVAKIVNWCDFISWFAFPSVFFTCIGAASFLFYKTKLKIPLSILDSASQKITANDLDFSIFYDSKDEMGKLCESFEKMRASLEKNYSEMWHTIEERKRVNAAFSHDLRTPLTVLKGYNEMMKKYIPEDKIPKEKLLETVDTMECHLIRLERYVDEMSVLGRMEDMPMIPNEISFQEFVTNLKDTAQIVCGASNKNLMWETEKQVEVISVDNKIILQVFENLMGNAVRFANRTVKVTAVSEKEEFTLLVEDDGIGFTKEELEKATEPFYRGNQNDSTHFGIGLCICKILTEKHGGNIHIANSKTGGACITVNFKNDSNN